MQGDVFPTVSVVQFGTQFDCPSSAHLYFHPWIVNKRRADLTFPVIINFAKVVANL